MNKKNNYLDSEVYTDKLVYLRSDSSLLTGNVQTFEGHKLVLEVQFCDGKPCKQWVGYIDSDTLHVGNYINLDLTFTPSFYDVVPYYFVDEAREYDVRFLRFKFVTDDAKLFDNAYTNELNYDSIAIMVARSIPPSYDIDFFYLQFCNSVYKPTTSKFVKYNIDSLNVKELRTNK